MNWSKCPIQPTAYCGHFPLWIFVLILAGVILLFPGCATKPTVVPGPAIKVLVPVPVACEIEQVAVTPRLTAPKGGSIFDNAKTIAADRRLLMAENARLRAANSNPCPAR